MKVVGRLGDVCGARGECAGFTIREVTPRARNCPEAEMLRVGSRVVARCDKWMYRIKGGTEATMAL